MTKNEYVLGHMMAIEVNASNRWLLAHIKGASAHSARQVDTEESAGLFQTLKRWWGYSKPDQQSRKSTHRWS